MTLTELDRQIKKQALLPVYYLHGEEEFLLERTVARLVDCALGMGDRSFNHHVFWSGEHKAAGIVASANEFPFMSERRVVVVRDADKLLDDAAMAAYVQSPAKETVMLLVSASAQDARKKKKPAKKKGADTLAYLQSPSNTFGQDVTVEFAPLKEGPLAAWIVEEAERHGKTFAEGALPLLLSLKGSSTREIANDLEKLHSALAEETVITEDDIYAHLGISRQYNLYELTNKVFEQNTASSLEIALALLEGTHATVLVSTLARDCATLWQIDSLQRARKKVTEIEARQIGAGGLWRYNILRKYLENVRRPKYFDSCFQSLLEADIELKSRPTDQKTVIARLIHQLTSRV